MNFNCKKYFSILWFAFVSIYLYAQEKGQIVPKRVYTTKNIDTATPPEIDGMLNDEVWDIVLWASDFIELQPDENTPPSQQTKFKIIYDDKYLYIGIRALDSVPDKIVKRLSRRDGFDGDYVEVHIDSYHDLRSGFSFTTTAAGVKGDQFISNNGDDFDDSWNPIWYTRSNLDDQGWTAEMKIPLSQLRFGKSHEQIWGIQVLRRLFREEELSVWQRVPVNSPGWVSELGELHGLIDIKHQKQIEIQPYVLAQYDTRPKEEGNPFQDGDDFTLSGGLDAKIGITNNLTLDLTVNPDFGQVEADPAAIALDGFEIFFREQRPFFVENKNIYDFQFADNQDNIFFSRRIGRSPQGFPNAKAGEFIDQPKFTTILGAAKFSGKTKKGWSIGILESVTAKEYAEIDSNGERRKELVEPLTNYFVGRLQKDFNKKNSFIGGIFTATNRKIEGNLDFLRARAYTGGFDFKHQWKERKYYTDGNFIASNVQGSKEAITRTQKSLTHLFQRVDAKNVSVDPNRTSLTGTGGRVEAGKAGSGHWRYNGGFLWRSPELELNDIGFLRRADNMKQYAKVSFQTLKTFGKFRTINTRFAQFTSYDFDGNYNRLQLRLTSFAQFKNYWWTNIGFMVKPRIFSNSALRGGPRFRYSSEYINWWFVGSDSRKKLRFDLGYVISQAKQDHFSLFRVETSITYQPTNSLNISINPQFEYAPNKTQYVTEKSFNGDPRYITAEIDNQTLSASVRINYTINPNLTIQFYGEPFVSRGNYSNFNYITDAAADDLNDRFALYDDNQISKLDGVYQVDENEDGNTDYSFGEPDFAFVQYRSNLVLRWEYIPGSEVFLVWSQGTTGFGDPNDSLFDNLNKEIIQQKPDNTYLIKATFRYVF